ncbi:MAG: hypothetical protein Fur0037_07790 [Planctomycetota bacterium]
MNEPGEKDQWSPVLLAVHVFTGLSFLLLASLAAALRPSALLSPSDPWTLAVTHLVTIGFVGTIAIGALHAIGPLALGIRWRASPLDWILLAALALAASGVASHMALDTFADVAWAGSPLLLVLALMAPRWFLGLCLGNAPAVVRFGIGLALFDLCCAVAFGIALAMDRTMPLLPAGHQEAVFAHAHLAGGGFAATLVVSVGLRLLPMFLPAEPARGAIPWIAVLSTGLGGLSAGLPGAFLPRALPWSAAPIAFGLFLFALLAARMVRLPKPPPRDLRRPDPSRFLQILAMAVCPATLAAGLALSLSDGPSPSLRILYGLSWLLGCLGTLILGMQLRILPLARWHQTRRRLPPGAIPPAPNRTWSFALAWAMATCWVLGLALAALGSWRESPLCLRAGASLLASAAFAALANAAIVWGRGRPRGTSQQGPCPNGRSTVSFDSPQ